MKKTKKQRKKLAKQKLETQIFVQKLHRAIHKTYSCWINEIEQVFVDKVVRVRGRFGNFGFLCDYSNANFILSCNERRSLKNEMRSIFIKHADLLIEEFSIPYYKIYDYFPSILREIKNQLEKGCFSRNRLTKYLWKVVTNLDNYCMLISGSCDIILNIRDIRRLVFGHVFPEEQYRFYLDRELIYEKAYKYNINPYYWIKILLYHQIGYQKYPTIWFNLFPTITNWSNGCEEYHTLKYYNKVASTSCLKIPIGMTCYGQLIIVEEGMKMRDKIHSHISRVVEEDDIKQNDNNYFFEDWSFYFTDNQTYDIELPINKLYFSY